MKLVYHSITKRILAQDHKTSHGVTKATPVYLNGRGQVRRDPGATQKEYKTHKLQPVHSSVAVMAMKNSAV